MKVNNMPFEFQNKLRLIIITALLSGDKSFNELKIITQATDGNLSSKLKSLEEAKFITITKSYQQNKPNTICRLTDYGKELFIDYVRELEKYIK